LSLMDIDIHDPAPSALEPLREAISRGLEAFNLPRVGASDFQQIGVAARDRHGRLLGGAYGHTAWRWLFVDLLWVDERVRGHGVGTRLLRHAEDVARARGCLAAYLDTFDFQARPFYERLGYAVFGVQENYPPGHQRFYLSKSLV
jgi:GNAT superfamily N-acetyltransferase